MAEFIGKLFTSSVASVASSVDDDFADYATPSPVAEEAASTFSPIAYASSTPVPGFTGPWYAVWERHSLSEFKTEGYVFILIAVVVAVHLWGSKRNRTIAKGFITAIAPVLTREFAMVGFNEKGTANTIDADSEFDAEKAVKENSNLEFVSYASGRANVAFMHTTIGLQRRNNPMAWLGEYLASFMFESIPEPTDHITITMSPFDGGELFGRPTGNSKYDNFVWALVNKRNMRRWRDERYDLSLTRTSDWDGLPNWLAVMGESKEIGDTCLYKDLKDVIGECSSFLEYLIVTDMPKERPAKLSELNPKKRITLALTMPSESVPAETLQRLLSAFIRLADHLCANARFRPEVTRKIKLTREDEVKKLKRSLEEETKEERDFKRAEDKKTEREAKLRNMSASEQKKFLEKERQKEQKGMAKKAGRKG
ncbi:hypothetical protein EDC01DRAFT_297659 [Geopyxis carbonaria]|nr:hypothetical protein EDC01DRAFT_297659 [Geopyxis carbonaria]